MTPNTSGASSITVVANDGSLTFARSFVVNVTATPTPPAPPPSAPNPPTLVAPAAAVASQAPASILITGIAPGTGSVVSLTVSVTDPSLLSALAVTQPVAGNATVSFTPIAGKVGRANLIVTADNLQSSNHLSTATIPLAIVAPVITATATLDAASLTTTFSDVTDYTPAGTTPTARTWDFGDGTGTVTSTTPTHTYAAPGLYTVKLTATLLGQPLVTIRTGLIRIGHVGVGTTPGPQTFATLALAVANASAGQIVAVAPGTYSEPALLVQKTLTIVGPALAAPPTDATPMPIFQPTATSSSAVNPYGNANMGALVDVGNPNDGDTGSNETVNLDGIRIDGSAARAASGFVGVGVFFHSGSAGSLTNCVVTGVRDASLSSIGNQRGVAIRIHNGSSTAGNTITIANNFVSNFEKNAMLIWGMPGILPAFTANVWSNTFVGLDPTLYGTQNSQNGVQVGSYLNNSTPDPVNMNCSVVGNTFIQFGPSGSSNATLGNARVASDASTGMCTVILTMVNGTVTVAGNVYTECQGIFEDDRGIIDSTQFVATNTITGGRYVTDTGYFQAYWIFGVRSDDPNVLNHVRFFASEPDTLVIGPGTYTLSADLPTVRGSSASFALQPPQAAYGTVTVTCPGGQATIRYPISSSTVIPQKLIAGSGVTLVGY